MSLTILISNIIPEPLIKELRTRFPTVTFTQLPENDTLTPPINAEIFLRCATPKKQQEILIQNTPDLRWVHTCSAGFDYLPMELLTRHAITVTRSAQTNNIPIAEFTLATILAYAKRLTSLRQAQQQNHWQRRDDLQEINGATVSIIGAGSIGQELAKRCHALGMRVLATNRHPTPLPNFTKVLATTDLPILLKEADYLVIACPLTPETRGLISTNELSQMKASAYLINIARGPIIDENALIQALKTNTIAGAALDVFNQEPLPEDHPFWHLPNVTLTPHISYVSPHNMQRMVQEFSANLQRYIKQQPLQNTFKNTRLGY